MFLKINNLNLTQMRILLFSLDQKKVKQKITFNLRKFVLYFNPEKTNFTDIYKTISDSLDDLFQKSLYIKNIQSTYFKNWEYNTGQGSVTIVFTKHCYKLLKFLKYNLNEDNLNYCKNVNTPTQLKLYFMLLFLNNKDNYFSIEYLNIYLNIQCTSKNFMEKLFKPFLLHYNSYYLENTLNILPIKESRKIVGYKFL